jgi:hypothetical protein
MLTVYPNKCYRPINSCCLDFFVAILCLYTFLLSILELTAGIYYKINPSENEGFIQYGQWLIASGATTFLFAPILTLSYFVKDAFVCFKVTGWNVQEFGEWLFYWFVYTFEIGWSIIGAYLLWNYSVPSENALVVIMYISVVSYLTICGITMIYLVIFTCSCLEPFKRIYKCFENLIPV